MMNGAESGPGNAWTGMSSEPPMILKMNFNFNFKDMLRRARQSIRTLTIACDLDHMVGNAG